MTRPSRRIVIVDDHDAVRRGVRQLIETKPYFQIVGEASDGRNALKLAKETRPTSRSLIFQSPSSTVWISRMPQARAAEHRDFALHNA